MADQAVTPLNVLFLATWYPHRFDAMAGLFIRKHAQAVALTNRVCVIYLHPDIRVDRYEVETTTIDEKLTEIIVYYPEATGGLFMRFRKLFRFFKAYRMAFQAQKSVFRMPDIAHVHVLTRNGIPALYLKKTQRIPYVITEHWTRYLPQNFSYNGFIHNKLTEVVVENASCVMPVSESLREAMCSVGLDKTDYKVVPNVVDDFFFEATKTTEAQGKIEMLHVSCFDERQKNMTGIVRAIDQLRQKRSDFHLTMVGTGVDFDRTVAYADELQLSDFITFTGEQTPEQVCGRIFKTDFFVLFSRYENAPVVLSECIAAGVPMISTDVGGISEMINPTNGILIASEDEQALHDKIDWMLDNYQTYDSEAIRRAGAIYRSENIGNVLDKIYREAIEKRKR